VLLNIAKSIIPETSFGTIGANHVKIFLCASSIENLEEGMNRLEKNLEK